MREHWNVKARRFVLMTGLQGDSQKRSPKPSSLSGSDVMRVKKVSGSVLPVTEVKEAISKKEEVTKPVVENERSLQIFNSQMQYLHGKYSKIEGPGSIDEVPRKAKKFPESILKKASTVEEPKTPEYPRFKGWIEATLKNHKFKPEPERVVIPSVKPPSKSVTPIHIPQIIPLEPDDVAFIFMTQNLQNYIRSLWRSKYAGINNNTAIRAIYFSVRTQPVPNKKKTAEFIEKQLKDPFVVLEKRVFYHAMSALLKKKNYEIWVSQIVRFFHNLAWPIDKAMIEVREAMFLDGFGRWCRSQRNGALRNYIDYQERKKHSSLQNLAKGPGASNFKDWREGLRVSKDYTGPKRLFTKSILFQARINYHSQRKFLSHESLMFYNFYKILQNFDTKSPCIDDDFEFMGHVLKTSHSVVEKLYFGALFGIEFKIDQMPRLVTA